MSLQTKILPPSFITELPGDLTGLKDSRQTRGQCFSLTSPTPVARPHLLAWSENLGDAFGLHRPGVDDEDTAILAGNRVTTSMRPFASCYGGHQFGRWAGQLGDGRALTLGELVDREGQRWELQLKGAGPTPYSRFADGRAVLRSSLREFLASEAMFHLGVPTTRALSIVTTGDHVVRDMFYNGQTKAEPGAITARMAPSFLRFGHFEIHASWGDTELLKKLLDETIRRYFPHLSELQQEGVALYTAWFQEVCLRTARLMVEWERVGFVHGVMNTDNMSVLGLTIDYGPFGWLDSYDPSWTPNTSDWPGRRYAFGRQASVALWNLQRLAEAILPVVGKAEDLEQGFEVYVNEYHSAALRMQAAKLGLPTPKDGDHQILFESLKKLLTQHDVDPVLFYRKLSEFNFLDDKVVSTRPWTEEFNETYHSHFSEQRAMELQNWLVLYQQRLQSEESLQSRESQHQRLLAMQRVNPKFVPRNHLLHEVIQEVEQGEIQSLEEYYSVLRHPYDEHKGFEKWSAKCPPNLRQKPGCSALSCSS